MRHHRQIENLWGVQGKAGPGRPKGSRNKNKLEIEAAAKRLIESTEYRQSLQQRLIEGKAPHMEPILFYYAYGKPVDRVALTDSDGHDAFTYLLVQLWRREDTAEITANGHDVEG